MLVHRDVGAPWVRVAGVVALVAVVGGAVACMIEREPAAPPTLLRDTIAAAPPRPAVDAGRSGDAGAQAPPSVAPSASAAIPPATTMVVAPPVPDAFRACLADSDCVAVLPNGCCHDGRQVAMNKGSVAAYTSSFTCPDPAPRCPDHLVLDNREPVCDAASHRCELAPPKG